MTQIFLGVGGSLTLKLVRGRENDSSHCNILKIQNLMVLGWLSVCHPCAIGYDRGTTNQ
jgi:hypothetical protein